MSMNINDDIQDSLKKLHLENVNWNRAITTEELLYLLDRCPFLQIVSTGNSESLSTHPNFLLHLPVGPFITMAMR